MKKADKATEMVTLNNIEDCSGRNNCDANIKEIELSEHSLEEKDDISAAFFLTYKLVEQFVFEYEVCMG